MCGTRQSVTQTVTAVRLHLGRAACIILGYINWQMSLSPDSGLYQKSDFCGAGWRWGIMVKSLPFNRISEVPACHGSKYCKSIQLKCPRVRQNRANKRIFLCLHYYYFTTEKDVVISYSALTGKWTCEKHVCRYRGVYTRNVAQRWRHVIKRLIFPGNSNWRWRAISISLMHSMIWTPQRLLIVTRKLLTRSKRLEV